MGHKSKKNRQITPPPYPQMDIGSIGQAFNNIDINSISNMLNNMDINQIVSMLSNTLTNQTNTSPPSPASEVKVKNEEGSLFNSNLQNLTSQNLQPESNPLLPPNDPIVMVLNSIKPLLPPDKSKIIDDFTQLIGIKIIIDKIFPPLYQGNSMKAAEDKEALNNSSNDIKENL